MTNSTRDSIDATLFGMPVRMGRWAFVLPGMLMKFALALSIRGGFFEPRSLSCFQQGTPRSRRSRPCGRSFCSWPSSQCSCRSLDASCRRSIPERSVCKLWRLGARHGAAGASADRGLWHPENVLYSGDRVLGPARVDVSHSAISSGWLAARGLARRCG